VKSRPHPNVVTLNNFVVSPNPRALADPTPALSALTVRLKVAILPRNASGA
jgi:hypothetical protein